MSEKEKHGNPMVRCPEALHPLVKEFARLYRSGNQDKVLQILQQALTTLSTGAITAVSSQDADNVLVDILDRLNRIEKAVFPTVSTSDNSNVDITLHTGDNSNGLMSTSSSDNDAMHTGDSSNVDTITKDSRLTQAQLARRFGHFNSKTGKPDNSRISKKQRASDFQQWSWSHDPEGIGWRFDPDAKMFYPVFDDVANLEKRSP